MGFINIYKHNLDLNLKKKYRIIQVSDLHMNGDKDEKSLKEEADWYNKKKYFANLNNEECTQEHMIPSVDIMGKVIDFLNNEEADLVVFSGDMIDFYSESNCYLLNEYFLKLNKPYLYLLGNHDKDFNKMNVFINNDPSFQMIDLGEFVIIGIDDSKRSIDNSIISRLDKVTKPIVLVCHIPIKNKFNQNYFSSFDEYFYLDENCLNGKALIDLINRKVNIKVILASHLHGHHVIPFSELVTEYVSTSALVGGVSIYEIR